MALRKQVFSAIRWTAGARAISQVITWAITLVVVRLLTPGDYGLLAMASIFLGFMVTLADAGMGPFLVQRPELTGRIVNQMFGLVLLVYLALAGLLVLTAPLIAQFFDEPRLVSVARVLSLHLVLGSLAVVPDAVLQRTLQFRNRSVLELGAAVLGSLTTLGLAMAGAGVWALVSGTLTTQAVRTLGVNLLARTLAWPELSWSSARALLKIGSQTSASGFVSFLLMQADSFIAGKWLGKDLLGAYSVAMHLASLPNQRISALVGQVAFPAFSRIQHDTKLVASSVLLGVRVLSMFSFPIFWGLSCVASEFVHSILGPKWLASVLPLQVISLVMPLRTLNTFVPNAILGLGKFDIALKNVALSFAIFVVAFMIGVQWGLTGLCLAWLVCMPIASLITMRINMKVLGTPMNSFFISMARPAIAAFVMYCIVSLCRSTVLSSVSDLPKLALGIIVGFISYVGVIMAIDRKGVNELIGLLQELAGKRER